ncbi:TIGR04255 family protein [candidate division KSB1 bacterium]|nr:TIGR04255 family protein [candidate division KSB1 bacterium]
MGKRYKNPPIAEAICEFQFELNSPWDLVMPGLVYEQVKRTFPKRHQVKVLDVGVSADPEEVEKQVRTTLERLYTFREREEVLWFLERYPFLVSLLLDAYKEIGNYFPYSQVFLEVITDPEATEDSQLVIFIATNLAPDKADDRLERFDEDWWLDALDRAQGKLCIDMEFR